METHIEVSPHVNGGPPVVNGRGLLHKKLTRKQLVSLAADLATGQRQLQPSLKQVSLVTGTPVAAISAEIKARMVPAEDRPANATQGVLRLVAAWDRASEDERKEAVRLISPARVWDTLADVIA